MQDFSLETLDRVERLHSRHSLADGTLTVAVVISAATMVFAPSAGATPGCESVPWGFLGSQVRTLCDGPMMADGSWMRARVIWVPAHQVPFTCSYSRYSSSCSGGYFVDDKVVSAEEYPVRPETVLPDEPRWLGPAEVPSLKAGLYRGRGASWVVPKCIHVSGGKSP
ncbi:hypothetical protein [Mycolicibacterium sp.]|uniref:CDGP domain-containing protein n=1 Tax=Mycolicibacterium sp. TaxID=2320850 RepID=UPI0037C88F71